MSSATWIFEYLYRDAANFKSWGSVQLSACTGEIASAISVLFTSGDNIFVAEQLGLPLLYDGVREHGDGSSIHDHAFHEFSEIRPLDRHIDVVEKPWGEASRLRSLIEGLHGQWDVRLSSYCAPLREYEAVVD